MNAGSQGATARQIFVMGGIGFVDSDLGATVLRRGNEVSYV